MARAQARYPDDFWVNYTLGDSLLRYQGSVKDAARYLTGALAVRPDVPFVHAALGKALQTDNDLDGAIRVFREAVKIDPKDEESRKRLSHALSSNGQIDEAIREMQAAVKTDVNGARTAIAKEHRDFAMENLGTNRTWPRRTNLNLAFSELQSSLKMDPRHSGTLYRLAWATLEKATLEKKGDVQDVQGALLVFRNALIIDSQNPQAHLGLGVILEFMGDLDGAIREYQAAVDLKPDYQSRHKLGSALYANGDLKGAIREIAAANEYAHGPVMRIEGSGVNLNIFGELCPLLYASGDFDGAIRMYRLMEKSFKSSNMILMPAFHYQLGNALAGTGDFEGAIREYRTFLKKVPKSILGHKALNIVSNMKRLMEILDGKSEPADVAERLQLTSLCMQPYIKRNTAAVRYFREIFATEPRLAQDHSYNAACAAALAGCGQGKDAPTKEPDRAKLRREALDWLKANLAACRSQIEADPKKAHAVVAKKLQHWQRDLDLAGVRASHALAKLPETERGDWQKFWREVAELLQRTGQARVLLPPPGSLQRRLTKMGAKK